MRRTYGAARSTLILQFGMFRGSFTTAVGGLRGLDLIVTGGLVCLVAFTALAFGAVHRGSLALMESLIFALVIVWMTKVWMDGPGPARMRVGANEFRRLAIPAAVLLTLLAIQIVPIPAPLLRIISPATYRIYQVSFPAWPGVSPYQGLAAIRRSGSASNPEPLALLQPVGADRQAQRTLHAADGASIVRASRVAAPLIPHGISGLRWRTLSIAPSVTASELIEAVALGAVFFLVLLYPFGLVGEREAEARFCRVLLLAVLVTATAVAIIGLAEREWWNGKILWFLVPEDWGQPLITDSPRASGPFIDPDHFANYLAMVLPLTVTGIFFALPQVAERWRSGARLFCASATFVMAAAIVLSLSRAGWITATVGGCAALALSFGLARERAPLFIRRLGKRALPLSIAGFALLFAMVLYLIGPGGRTQAGTRLAATAFEGENLQYRPAVWKDTLMMIPDFPLFGVGLGCWPEIFPHYQRPPWMSFFFFRETENDYLQFTVETGLIGLATLIWFACLIGLRLARCTRRLSPRQLPLYAGLLAGIGGAMLHEALDFSFHTPANALLFTILLALALRIALTEGVMLPTVRPRIVAEATRRPYFLAACTGAAALGLIVAAYVQDGASYPYDIEKPTNLARAETNVAAHPAVSAAHLALTALMARTAPTWLQRDEFSAAAWLDPNDPEARDLYARSLLLEGKKQDGLREISQSVYRAPRLDAHYYLAPRLIPWLLPDEQSAIATGFDRAVAAGFGSSIDELAAFYGYLGRYKDAANLYARAAHAKRDGSVRLEYLVKAGRNYVVASDVSTGTKMLREASKIDPTDPGPYIELVKSIFRRAGDVSAAKTVVDEGIRRGADPYPLEVALAEAAEKAGDHEAAEQALEQALHYAPTFDVTMRLANLYLSQSRFERAVLTLQRATEMNPGSAEAFYELGHAQEGSYDYFAAGKAYAHATELAPGSDSYRRTYLEFEQRTAEAAKENRAVPVGSRKATDSTAVTNADGAETAGEPTAAATTSGATPAIAGDHAQP